MKNLFLMAILTSFLSACAATPSYSPSAEKALNDPGFTALMDGNVEQIKNNPDYNRIPIDTPEQEDEFLTLYYKAYQKEITKEEFVQAMNAKYPDHAESIQWNADQLPD